MKKFKMTRKKKIIKVGVLTVGLSALAFSLFACQGGGDHHKYYGKKMFKKIDTNSDGILTKGEFRAKLEKKFAKMDSDNNGEVTKSEFEQHCDKMKEKKKKHRFHGKKKFEKMDLNSDGIVTKSELDAKLEKKFTKIDTDNNGEVTKSEFKQHHREMKKKWKENK